MEIKVVGSKLILHLALILLLTVSCTKTEQNKLKSEADDIQILLDLSTKVYEERHEKSLQYALTALDLAKKRNDEKLQAIAMKTVADIYYKLNFPRKSLPYYYSAIDIFEKENNQALVSSTYQAVGDAYYKLTQADSALRYYTVLLKTYQEKGDKAGIGSLFYKIGNVYWITNNYDKSLEYYLNSLSIYEELKNLEGLSQIYINIGLVYYITEYYDKSLEYFRKSENILKQKSNVKILGDLYYRMGDSYAKKKLYIKALGCYDLSIHLFDSIHNDFKVAWVYQSKAEALKKNNRIDQAINLISAALGIGQTYDDDWFNASLYNRLSQYQIEKGLYKEALTNLKKGEALADRLKAWSLLKENFMGFSLYYSALGDYKSSLNYFRKFQQASDSIHNKERNERIAQLQTRFEAERNKKELELKEKEIIQNKEKLRKQEYQLYIFALGVVVVLFMSFALYRQYRILEVKGKKIERINEELDQRVKERTSALRLTQFSVDHASDPIFWLTPSGNYFFANKSACENLQYTKEELEQLSITDVIPNFTKSDWDQFWEIIKKDKSLILESHHKKRTGQTFAVEIILNHVDHEGNEFAFAYVRDISERKQKEENLRKAKEKAEEADKLKSAFLANMSHEIRTPMNAIIGFSDLLVTDEYTEEEKKEFGNLIKNSGSALLKLIDDIIDISIMEAGHLKLNKTSVNVNSHLNEFALFFQEEKERLCKGAVNIVLNLPPNSDKILIETDPVRFRQVINNLIGNALKFTEVGAIEVGYTVGNDPVLHFYVKDSGIGIRPEKIGVIFERFNKLDDERKLYAGTGLGLTISKKIVEELGGFMYVESEYGKGSIFSFTLPYYTFDHHSHEGLLDIVNTKTNLHNWENKKILIVEDVDSNYMFLETIIAKTKAKITWAKSGKEAISLCDEIVPDLILMDIQLPELNGYDATKLIRKRHQHIPIIAQSAYAFAGEKEKIINSGCNDYLTKPIKPNMLIEIINKYI
jgi:PAS domain S-box-containing protein